MLLRIFLFVLTLLRVILFHCPFSPRWHVVLLYSKEYPKYKHNLLLPF